MRFDELPDLALHKICLKLEAKDITSLQETNRKLFNYIRANRCHYKRHRVSSMLIRSREDGNRDAKVFWFENKKKLSMTLKEPVENVMKSFIPQVVRAYDHDELANMSPLWWKGITEIRIGGLIDYRRYLPHFDRCTYIALQSDNPMNLTEILAPMETKNLQFLRLSGFGGLECTDDDFRKIGRLSNKMMGILFSNISESSNVSYDAILDMIEIGCFENNSSVFLSKSQDDLIECIRRRNWVINHEVIENHIKIRKNTGVVVWIRLVEKNWHQPNYWYKVTPPITTR